MTPKLARMTQGGAVVCRTCREDGGQLDESFMSGMAKATMPQGGGGCSDQGVSWRKIQRVQGPGAIAPDD